MKKVLLVEEKWQLIIYISRSFCNITSHFYSSFILPYTIYAKKIKEIQAKKKTLEKREALRARTEEFEKWKASRKKKKARALFSGESEKEEVDYKKDVDDFNDQIKILQGKEDQLTEKRKLAEKVLDSIKRG